MAKALGVATATAGRVALLQATRPVAEHAHPQVHVVIKISGHDSHYLVEGTPAPVTDSRLMLVNPWVVHSNPRDPQAARTVLLALYIDAAWFADNCRRILRGYRDMPFPRTFGRVTPEIRALADEIARRLRAPEAAPAADPALLDDRIDRLMRAITAQCCPAEWTPGRDQRPRDADYRIRRAVRIMREAPRKSIDLTALAQEVGLSRSHFFARFHHCMGISPGLYVDSLCCEWAAQRLGDRRRRIGEISAELGFAAQSHFTRFFKSKTGVTPRDFRNAHFPDARPVAAH